MTLGHHFLEQICPRREDWKIKVRKTRMWDAINVRNNELIGLDMILLDEHGDHINAFIRKNQVLHYRSVLKEGRIYFISHFKVVPNKNSYKVVHHEYMINFVISTFVEEVNGEDLKFPVLKFEFLNFHDISSRYQVDTYLTDVIGRLKSITPVTEIQAKGSLVNKRTIVLEDNQHKSMSITLWAAASVQLEDDFFEDNSQPIVVIVTSTTVKMFKGEYSLSSTNATKVYINLEIPEVAEFMESISQVDCQVHKLINQQKVEIPDEELMFRNRNTLREIIQITDVDVDQETTYCCKATVTRIINDFGWFYESCNKCRKKVKKHESTFWCDKCDIEVECPIPRFILRMEVADMTSNATFVLFEKLAEKVIHHHLEELHEISQKENGQELLSSLLQTLIDSTYVFQIRLNDYNLKHGSRSYTVTKVFALDYVLESRYLLSLITEEIGTPQASLVESQSPSSPKLENNSSSNQGSSTEESSIIELHTIENHDAEGILFSDESPKKRFCIKTE